MRVVVRRKQLALLGHILRRPFHDPDRLACFEPDTSLKPRQPQNCHSRIGAPRKTWFKSLLPLFTTNGIAQDTLHHRAQDHSGWYSLSESLCSWPTRTAHRWDQIWPHLWDQIWPHLWDQIWSHVRDQVWSHLDYDTYCSLLKIPCPEWRSTQIWFIFQIIAVLNFP